MFYIRPQERITTCSLFPLNEQYLLNDLRREYYRQQQIEKRQRQKLNQPDVEFTQNLDEYFIILNKKLSRDNYKAMKTFEGYSIRLVDDSLIIKSKRDNFYKSVQLPENVAYGTDITYRLYDDGYKMVISIPKKKAIQIKTPAFGFPDLFDNLRILSDVFDSPYVGRCNEGRKIRIPISDSNESDEVSINKKGIEDSQIGNEEGKEQLDERMQEETEICNENASAVFDSKHGRDCEAKASTPLKSDQTLEGNSDSDWEDIEDGNENVLMDIDEEPKSVSINQNAKDEVAVDGKSENRASVLSEQPDLLKNYKTTLKNTVFVPNMARNDDPMSSESESSLESPNSVEESTAGPARRTYSPSIENVVDAEFL
ncbi:unnamed protein product [Pichia kudriavzevii]